MKRFAIASISALIISMSLAGRAEAGPGSWFLTGPMVVGRWALTLTALDHGRALAAGGFAPGTTTATAEIYDPIARSWTAAGSMNVARSYHTATRLADGRVLITGGSTPYPSYTSAAEIYDPASRRFTLTGSMSRPRTTHTATRLTDGRVLIAGNTGDGSEATAEIYDPLTGTFTPTGSMNNGRGNHVAALLVSGKVLVAGGCGPSCRTTELYDPLTGTWSVTGDIGLARDSFAAVVLPLVPGDARVPAGGEVLIAGGRIAGGAATASAELYDPATGTWSETVSMHVARMAFDMTLGNELGYVPAAGGTPNDANTTSLNSYELYYGAGWAIGGSLNQPRAYHRIVTLTDGFGPLAAGGYDYGSGNPAQSGEVQQPPPPPLPTTTGQCMDGGWTAFKVFQNQGDCVSFVATKGRNPPSK